MKGELENSSLLVRIIICHLLAPSISPESHAQKILRHPGTGKQLILFIAEKKGIKAPIGLPIIYFPKLKKKKNLVWHSYNFLLPCITVEE